MLIKIRNGKKENLFRGAHILYKSLHNISLTGRLTGGPIEEMRDGEAGNLNG